MADASLEGKSVVVTGAGGGIGREIALMMAREGASVLVNDVGATLRGDGEAPAVSPAEKVVEEIRAFGGTAAASRDSVSEGCSARRIVEAALDAFGRLDAVVNNAGILRDGFFHKMTEEDFDAVVKVHLYGAFHVSRAAADAFRAQGTGVCVHMTSTSGLIGNLAQANYSAAKLGVAALSKSIALDMRRFGVRSNCIAPFAWSRMTSSIKVDSPEQEARVAKLREMKAEHVAPLAAFLASDAAADVTGQIFAVRGREIFLFNQPRPVRSVHSAEDWTPATVAARAIPALRPSFAPLDVSGDVFSWDPA